MPKRRYKTRKATLNTNGEARIDGQQCEINIPETRDTTEANLISCELQHPSIDTDSKVQRNTKKVNDQFKFISR